MASTAKSNATGCGVARRGHIGEAKAHKGEREHDESKTALKSRENASETVDKKATRESGRTNREVRFVIEYPDTKTGRSDWAKRYGLNAYYSGKHWSERRRDAEAWHSLVHTELLRQRVDRSVFESPAELFFVWNDNLDCSNHAVIGKMIEDALVSAGMLRGDDRRHVIGIHHLFHDKPYIGVAIRGRG